MTDTSWMDWQEASPRTRQGKALKALIRFCTSGERYTPQNPYTVPAIKEAMKALKHSKVRKSR